MAGVALMPVAHRTLLERAQDLKGLLVDARRRIHAHPEVGFQEHQTAALVATTLSALGARVRTGVGITGVVGDIGTEGPTIAVRADMDALPIHEATGLEFASRVPGVMHACGHDAHVACALGAARLLAAQPLPGRVRFLFQPSEEQKDAEGMSGAMRLIAEGALDDVDAAIALHTRALPAGRIGLTPGPALAANDMFRIVVSGRGAHGAHPEDGLDAIAIAAQVVIAVNQIVSRRVAAISPAVVSVTTINGGIKENVLCDRVQLGGTIRTAERGSRARILEELERAVDVGRALGAECRVEILEGYPVLDNDDRVTASIRQAASDVLGSEAVVELPFDTWAEDFAYIAARVPASMFWLGVTSPRVPRPVWHTAEFDLDEDALPVGSAVLAAAAMQLMHELHARKK
jgi:amidohydrolase